MATPQEEREEAARLFNELRGSAVRRRVFALTTVAVAAASCAAIPCEFLTSLRDAALLSAAVFLLIAIPSAAILRRRTPGKLAVMRRLEERFPEELGVLVAALEPGEEDSELARSVRTRALALLRRLRALPDDELDSLFWGLPTDAAALQKRALRRRRLRVSTALLFAAAICCAAVSERGRSRHEEEPTPVATGVEHDINETAPEPSVPASPAPAVPAPEPTQTKEALEALVAELQRAAALARSLDEALAGNDRDALALAIELSRELERGLASPTGTIERTAAVAEDSARSLRTSRPESFARTFLTTRRASELLAFFHDEPARRDSFRASLSGALRGATPEERDACRADARGAAAALAERLTAEVAAFTILDDALRFDDDQTAAGTLDASLRAECVRMLTRRAGADPDETTQSASRVFLDLLAKRRAAWTNALERYEETRERLTTSEAVEFAAFAWRVLRDAGLESRLTFGDQSAAAYVEGALQTLVTAEKEAKLERWGRAATLLTAPPAYAVAADAETSETDALALRLTFGAISEPGTPLETSTASSDDEPTTPDDKTSDKIVDERELSDVDAATARALEREASLGETAAIEGRADLKELRDEIARRDGSDGVTSDRGNVADANFAGGGANADPNGPRTISDDEFIAELPEDVRERVERAEKWAPPEDYLRRAEEFRRRLWQETSKSPSN